MDFKLRITNKTYSTVDKEMNTVRLHIDVNTICNNKCLYCYARQEEHDWGLIMSDSYIDNILFPNITNLSTYLKKNNRFLDIVLLGGEPTLHPRFIKIYDTLSSLSNTRISITSNGNKNYNNASGKTNVRWAFTYHPSQVNSIIDWIKPILSRKDEWWEVAVSPLIDCWGSENIILEYSKRIKYVIDICHENDIKVQPTFQFNPYDEGYTHIDMNNVIKYYSYLENEEPIYQYGNDYLNDYQILKNNLNYIKNCWCVNNNIQLTVRGTLRRCCTNQEISWDDLYNLNPFMVCPLPECTCYGFLSIHKKI